MKKYDKIVGGFHKTIADLDNLKSANDQKALNKAAKIEKLEEERMGLLDESKAAAKTADKLRDFLA